MPKVTVYIRNEDMDLWKAIQKKSDFLHTMLTRSADEFKTITISDPSALRKHVEALERDYPLKPLKAIGKEVPAEPTYHPLEG
jgi:hypothetical protein